MAVEVEIVKIGFEDDTSLLRTISFLNDQQSTFNFKILENEKFTKYLPQHGNFFRTEELYQLIDEVLIEVKGIHPFTIGFLEKRLDGKEYGNLFGSMETRNKRLTGKALSTTYQVYDILEQVPIEIYYIFEFLSFSIRFLVGRGLIHDEDRGCLFHRKVNKSDIVDVIKSGFISLKRQKIINDFMDLEQIIEFKTILAIIGEIARSNSPKAAFDDFLKGKKSRHFSPRLLKKDRVFISYSHEDSQWLRRVQIHLKPFQREEFFDFWDDTKIEPGMNWQKEIESALIDSAVVVLLVSADFLASEYIADNELPPILERAEKEGLLVLVLVLKPCAFAESELAKFQSLNPPSRPLSAMSENDQEQTLFELARYTKKALKK